MQPKCWEETLLKRLARENKTTVEDMRCQITVRIMAGLNALSRAPVAMEKDASFRRDTHSGGMVGIRCGEALLGRMRGFTLVLSLGLRVSIFEARHHKILL